MKIDFEHRVWQLEMDEVTVRQAEQIQAYTGLTPVGWYKSILEVEAPGWLKSMQCLYGLMRQQNGDSEVPLPQLDFAPLKLMTAFAAGSGTDDADTAGEGEPDPTNPAGGNAAGSPAETNPSPV